MLRGRCLLLAGLAFATLGELERGLLDYHRTRGVLVPAADFAHNLKTPTPLPSLSLAFVDYMARFDTSTWRLVEFGSGESTRAKHQAYTSGKARNSTQDLPAPGGDLCRRRPISQVRCTGQSALRASCRTRGTKSTTSSCSNRPTAWTRQRSIKIESLTRAIPRDRGEPDLRSEKLLTDAR